MKNKSNSGLIWLDLAGLGVYLLSQSSSSQSKVTSGGLSGIKTWFKKNRHRKFIGIEYRGKQLIREDLLQFTREERKTIIRKIRDYSLAEQLKEPTYKRFKNVDVDFGRVRIGDFRIFVHRISDDEWLMLSIFRKTTKKTSESETNLALSRLFNYLSE